MKEQKPKQYIQVFIKSEADLPKWGTSSSIKMRDGEFYESMGYNSMQNKRWWLENAEYYYKPVEPVSDEDMYLNMQYYMEYCNRNGYITPQEWLKEYKHFGEANKEPEKNGMNQFD